MNFYSKYIKYKQKYLLLKGGTKKCEACTFINIANDRKNCEMCGSEFVNETNKEIKELDESNKFSKLEQKNRSYEVNRIKPIINSNSKKLEDIKANQFWKVPSDGFCGFWCLYNAIYNTNNEKHTYDKHEVFKIGILDDSFKSWLKSTLDFLKETTDEKKNKDDCNIINNLLGWLEQYNHGVSNITQYFDIEGVIKDMYYEEPELKISNTNHRDFISKYTTNLNNELYSTDTILGKIGDINGLNIIIFHKNTKQYIFPNDIKENRHTIIIKYQDIHWEWKEINYHEYKDDINNKNNTYKEFIKFIEKAYKNKYLKYKQKYLLLKSKIHN